MKRNQLLIHTFLFLFACLLTSTGCRSIISSYDQYAYAQSTAIKVDVLNLMDKATELYANHTKDIDDITTGLMKIGEYEKHRPNNGITVKMWQILFDADSSGKLDERRMIPSFLAKWKKDGTEKPAFIQEAKMQVAEGFDLIAELEANKIKPSDSNVQSFISENQ